REASIFSGVTIAEYYRDMGYDVAVLADSTSRWAESLREISGLLEEMPAEEGYPAYLPSKISSFYERAGKVEAIGNHTEKRRIGSLSIIGSVSPPAGDFSEPVTATTKRFVQAFWALDANLAYSKHYPAINWLSSYSNYLEYISQWWYERDIHWPEIDLDWYQCRAETNTILSKENELKNIVQLIGEENLPEEQQLILFIGKLIRESFLIQNAFDSIDNYTNRNKLLSHIKLILLFYNKAKELLTSGYLLEDIKSFEVLNDLRRISQNIPNDEFNKIEEIKNRLLADIQSIKLMYGGRKKE
ncbi:MAG: V-type ATP synthase subunit A, partial [Promethearchaeota archaeon]